MDQQASVSEMLGWSTSASTVDGNTRVPELSQKTVDAFVREVLSKQANGNGGSNGEQPRKKTATEIINNYCLILAPDSSIPVDGQIELLEFLTECAGNIDDAINMRYSAIWGAFLQLLRSDEPLLRQNAAMAMGEVLQNNLDVQKKSIQDMRSLIQLAFLDTSRDVRRAAVGALSRGVRNVQPALDQLLEAVPEDALEPGKRAINAGDMTAVNELKETLMQYVKREDRSYPGANLPELNIATPTQPTTTSQDETVKP